MGATGKTDSMRTRQAAAITQHSLSKSGGSAKLHQCRRTPSYSEAHNPRQDGRELPCVPPPPVVEALLDRVREAPLCTRFAIGTQSSRCPSKKGYNAAAIRKTVINRSGGNC